MTSTIHARGDHDTDTTPAAPDQRPPPVGRAHRWVPPMLAVLFAALYSVVSVRRFASWDAPSFDNAIFEQAIKAYAHLQSPIVDIKSPGFNILGDHFSPVIALLAPVYRVFPAAQTLLVAQAVLVAVSVVPIGRAGVRTLGPGAGTAVAAAYGLSFGIRSAINVDFHEVAFAVVLIAFTGDAFLQRRWTAVAGWMLPLLLVKEEMGLTVAAAGVVLLLVDTRRGPPTRTTRRAGLLLLGAGTIGFLVTVFVIIPSFNPQGTFAYWSAVGFSADGPSMFQTFVTGWDVKAVTVLLTLGITGFLSLRSPWVLLILPTLGWRLLEERDSYWGTNWHYSLILMPVVFTALIDAAGRARQGRVRWLRTYATQVPAVALTLAVAITPQFPFGKLLQADTYQAAERAAHAERAMATMTDGKTVETNLDMITHLVSDHHVYWLGVDIAPDYVAMGSSNPNFDVAADARRRHPGTQYVTVFADHGYFVAARTTP